MGDYQKEFWQQFWNFGIFSNEILGKNVGQTRGISEAFCRGISGEIPKRFFEIILSKGIRGDFIDEIYCRLSKYISWRIYGWIPEAIRRIFASVITRTISAETATGISEVIPLTISEGISERISD